jgi:hypothetical protein
MREVGGSHDPRCLGTRFRVRHVEGHAMNDTQYTAALAAAGQVAASYATARPSVTSDEHIKSIVRVFDAIFDAAIAKAAS